MKVMPISTSTANVKGSRMMMVLWAAKPGTAPTTMPNTTAGKMTHERLSEWPKSCQKKSKPTSIVGPYPRPAIAAASPRSDEHTSELQSLIRISYAVMCLKKKTYEFTVSKHKQP